MPQTAREIFELHKFQEHEPDLRGVYGSYLFEIKQVGAWYVSVNDGAIKVHESKREAADCVIRCSEEDFTDIVEGRRNLITAAMQGRIQIRGDIALAQKFHGLVSAAVERKRGEA